MLEIIDNLYLFSLSRRSYGEIIASRTCGGRVKRDIFSHLTLADGEDGFLSNAMACGREKLTVVMGKRDEKSVPILFLRGFCAVEGLGLAIEMLDPDPVVLRRSILGFSGGISVSDSVREMIEESFGARSTRNCEYLDSLGAAERLCEHARFCDLSLYDGILEISHLAGVEVEISESEDRENRLGVARQRLAGNELLSMLAITALAARENSPDRSLSVKIKHCEDAATVCCSFLSGGNDLDNIKRYLTDIAEDVGMIHSVTAVGDRLKCEVLPYVCDVSLVGVKAPDGMAVKLYYFGE